MIACVETDEQWCPTAISGYFNSADDPANFGCNTGGIVIAASSGGSFTH
jgi:hypothetical protein